MFNDLLFQVWNLENGLNPCLDITCDLTSTDFGDGGTGGEAGRDGDKERVKGTEAGRKGGRDGGKEGEAGREGGRQGGREAREAA